jgi:hypothetical protein
MANNALPRTIVERRKSGTRLPLEAYVGYLIEDGANLDVLKFTTRLAPIAPAAGCTGGAKLP